MVILEKYTPTHENPEKFIDGNLKCTIEKHLQIVDRKTTNVTIKLPHLCRKMVCIYD